MLTILTVALWWLWPLGTITAGWAALYSNLAATLLCFVFAYVKAWRPHRKSIDDLHDKIDELHVKHDQQAATIAALHRHVVGESDGATPLHGLSPSYPEHPLS